MFYSKGKGCRGCEGEKGCEKLLSCAKIIENQLKKPMPPDFNDFLQQSMMMVERLEAVINEP
jgi:hypothetical protein